MIRKIATAAALVLALALIGAGLTMTRKVYEQESGEDEFGMLIFHRIPERAIVEDATFGGVRRIDGKLVTTYDRTAGGGKRPCPT
jgi:hypothetical protein